MSYAWRNRAVGNFLGSLARWGKGDLGVAGGNLTRRHRRCRMREGVQGGLSDERCKHGKSSYPRFQHMVKEA